MSEDHPEDLLEINHLISRRRLDRLREVVKAAAEGKPISPYAAKSASYWIDFIIGDTKLLRPGKKPEVSNG
ncbi:hypothetical protein [Microbulbifer sp. VVAC002]|uniref:hypothetical protein n=1 Tax=Microbulbifer sp. VVAC002 TaxID=3243387 RepID=UPI00403A0EF1